MQQPLPSVAADSLDAIADRLMHALNFRVLPGGVQSYVLNFTVNVSGVNPTDSATYQGGVRWMELRRDAGTGAITINQQATYAPGAPDPIGRDVWMASIDQDHEGNIGLAFSATRVGVAPSGPNLANSPLNPTAIYTGRLVGQPPNTLPQNEVDVLASASVIGGVQTGTGNRWGDYSSLFADPSDDCTFWGAFEYVDAPTASFDWNTRVFSFKVNPTCNPPARGDILGTITNCTTGLPIPNATVTTPEGFLRSTDASGNFTMTVPLGTYTVTVTAPGFDTCTQTVTVGPRGGPNGAGVIVNCCLTGIPIIAPNGSSLISENCVPANGVLDPGETVTVSLCLKNTGGANTENLVATLLETEGVTNSSGSQSYGTVVAGGATVCRDFTFTVDPTSQCGDAIEATLQLRDPGLQPSQGTDLGMITYTFMVGAENIIFAENFDGVTAPALPGGWVSTFASGGKCSNASDWVTTTTAPDTAPNSAFHDDPNCITDNTLDTPAFTVISVGARLFFRNNYDTESGFDGGVLEVSSPNINAGAFTDITDPAVGGTFIAGGYNNTISTSFGSLIGGRNAWSGSSGGYIDTIADLGATVAGQSIKLRFRMASDDSTSAPGWNIDGVRVRDGFTCCTGLPTPSPSPSASPSPSPTPLPAKALNLSTRMRVLTDDQVGIGGFIVTGPVAKPVLIRAIGPSLARFGIEGILADPVLELHGPGAFATVTNDNWQDTQRAVIAATGIPPIHNLEAAIYAVLEPGPYTAIVRGKNRGTGIGLVEVYDLEPASPSALANISTRAFSDTGSALMIAGFILGGNPGNDEIIIRGIGPSLAALGVPNVLADPSIELRNGEGTLLASNNDWQDVPAQATHIVAAGLAPTDTTESAIFVSLPPGAYTALLTDQAGRVGNGLVEVYDLPPAPCQ